jgi:hypothetical protein
MLCMAILLCAFSVRSARAGDHPRSEKALSSLYSAKAELGKLDAATAAKKLTAVNAAIDDLKKAGVTADAPPAHDGKYSGMYYINMITHARMAIKDEDPAFGDGLRDRVLADLKPAA